MEDVMKTNTPTPNDTSKEFKKFHEFAKKLVSVPKRDIKDQEKKASKNETKKDRS